MNMKKTALVVSILIFMIPTLVLAQGYVPLVGIPGVPDVNTDFNSYINALYGLSISIAALLAVIKIVIAGVKWMMTDIVTSKGAAKEDIKGALLGLLVILGAVLILETINPNLKSVSFNFDPVAIRTNTPTVTEETLDTKQVKIESARNFRYLDATASPAQVAALKKDCIAKGSTFRMREAQPPQPRCYTPRPGQGVKEFNNSCNENTPACNNSAMKACEALKNGTGFHDTTILPTKGVFCYYDL